MVELGKGLRGLVASSPCGTVKPALSLRSRTSHSCPQAPSLHLRALSGLHTQGSPAGSVCTSSSIQAPCFAGRFPSDTSPPRGLASHPLKTQMPGDVRSSLPCLFSRPSSSFSGLGLEASDSGAGRQAVLPSQAESISAIQEGLLELAQIGSARIDVKAFCTCSCSHSSQSII